MSKYTEIFKIKFSRQYNAKYSLVAQKVKNPSAMQETSVRSLGWEHLLEEGMATDSSILACRIPMTDTSES